MSYTQEYAEGSSLIRVPVSVRDRLVTMRRKRWPDRTWSPLESLGQVIARLAVVTPTAPKKLHKKPVRKRGGRKVNNKARRPGRRHR